MMFRKKAGMSNDFEVISLDFSGAALVLFRAEINVILWQISAQPVRNQRATTH